MDENVASTLCYLLVWITGIIFYLTDKRPTVRFHATQSIVVFGALSILYKLLAIFMGFTFFASGRMGFSVMFGVFHLVELAAAVLWIFLMVKAYQGERFRVPFAADFADRIFGKS
jgi:uncharacterized membrane protein